jgi:hypothetical protein
MKKLKFVNELLDEKFGKGRTFLINVELIGWEESGSKIELKLISQPIVDRKSVFVIDTNIWIKYLRREKLKELGV